MEYWDKKLAIDKNNDSDIKQLGKKIARVAIAPKTIVDKVLSYADRPIRGILDGQKYIEAGTRAVAYAYGGPVTGVVTDILMGKEPNQKTVEKAVKLAVQKNWDQKALNHAYSDASAYFTSHPNVVMNQNSWDLKVGEFAQEYISKAHDSIEEEFDEKMKKMDYVAISQQNRT